MSVSRSGRIVRCSDCKSAIRIPKINKDDLTSGDLQVVAEMVKSAEETADVEDTSIPFVVVSADSKPQTPTETEVSAQADAPSDLQDTPLRGLEVPAPNFGSREQSIDSLKAEGNSKNPVSKPSASKASANKTPASNPPQSGIRPTLKTMDLIPASRVSAEQPIVHAATLAEHQGKSEDISTIFEVLTSPKSTGPDSIPEIKLVNPKEVVTEKEEAIDWEERLENANQDRRMLARFFAGCLCVVAIVNMTPALYHWYHWAQMTESMELPRWIYIQVFVGAIHLVYAVFLFQVSDWSAMRAVSVAMLLVAFVFGSVSTGLLVSGGQGDLSGFLGIPFSLSKQAAIWCVAMLCLATLMSYWGGKESLNWQRAELLLKDILARSAV